MVKQEIVRVNLNNLGISELKWTGMGEFNSDDQYIYYCGQKSLRKNAVALPVSLPDKLLQSRPTLSNPMNWGVWRATVHGRHKELYTTEQWSIAQHCISDSYIDYEGYSIPSKGFLPTEVDIIVIWIKFTHCGLF